MGGFKLLNYAGIAGEPRPGIAVGEQVIDLEEAGGIPWRTTLDVLGNWEEALPALTALAAKVGDVASRPLADVQLLAPILFPGAIYNAAANYIDHQKEMNDGKALDK